MEKHNLKKGRIYPLPEDEARKIPVTKKCHLDIDFGITEQELEEILGLIVTD